MRNGMLIAEVQEYGGVDWQHQNWSFLERIVEVRKLVGLLQKNTYISEIRAFGQHSIIKSTILTHDVYFTRENEINFFWHLSCFDDHRKITDIWPLISLGILIIILNIILTVAKLAIFKHLPFEARIDWIKVFKNYFELFIEVSEHEVE